MNNKMKHGTVAFLIAVVAFLLLVAVCIGVYYIPADFTLFNISGSPIDEVSEDTLSFISSLDEDVTIYWLCPNGEVNEELSDFLFTYLDASEHLKGVIVDITEQPDFAAKYTSATVTHYSFIVESTRRYQIVDTLDLYYYTNEYINYVAGGTYKIPAAQYSSMYATYGTYMDQAETRYYFDGESHLTAALDYVTADLIPHTYLLTGHGDGMTSDSLKTIMASAGILPTVLDLKKAEKAPDDANCIILFSPETDLSKSEADLLKTYINGGGSFLLVAGPDTSDFENLASVTALFGMGPSAGVVVDTNSQCYKGDITKLLPLINSNHPAMYSIGSMGYLAYMPNAMGISMDSTLPANVTATVMLGTSDSGYRASKDSARTPLCKPAAQFVAASAILETATADGTADKAYFAWFASDEAFTDEVLKNTSYGNYYYLAMTAKWMTEDEQFVSKYTTLAADDLTLPMLDGRTTATSIMIGMITVAILPLGILGIGLGIWLKRRGR